MADKTTNEARAAKQDEFYTQYVDIQKEVEAYLEFDPDTFRGRVVYCNCDDPFESNFFKYFAANFNKLGLKKLITTSYDGSPIAGQGTLFPEYDEGNGKRQKPKVLAVTLDHVKDEDGAANVTDVELFLKRNKAARIALKADDNYPGGDFRSPECIALLKEAAIVVTNPPFSLFREYVAQLVEYGKKFLIIGNVQALTYKEVFPLVKANKVWMGVTIHSGDREFRVPDHYPLKAAGWRVDENGVKYIRVKGVRWYTNLDHGRRHQKLPLMTMEDNLRFSKHNEIKGKGHYDRYDNYDAIEVPFTDAIPGDYDGMMGVPITFLDKYNPDQFEILGTSDNGIVDDRFKTTPGLTKQFVDDYYKGGGTGAYKEGNPTAGFYENAVAKMAYKRIFIRHKKKLNGENKFEVLDGQQRITSIGRFVTNKFATIDNGNPRNFDSLPADQRTIILDSGLLIYECEGTETEIKQWFETINIAGVPLNPQELLNAIYSGPFVTLAKSEFSNSQNANIQKWSAYVRGSANRQEFLERALDWVSKGDIGGYMSQHRNDNNITEVKNYFNSVIDWVSTVFIDVFPEMRGLEWGRLYEEYHSKSYDPKNVSDAVKKLAADDYVKSRKGIVEFLLGGSVDTKLLDIRIFETSVKRATYAKQKEAAEDKGESNCPLCAIGHDANKSRIYGFAEMDADHVTAWSKGGASSADNCQMLCASHNRAKGNW